MGGHDLGAEKEALGVADARDRLRRRRLLLLHLLQLFPGQHRPARPEREARCLEAHRLAPEAEPLVENVGQIEADLPADAPAGLHVDPLDLPLGHVGVREIPADDRVALGFERPRQIETQAVRELHDVVAGRHAFHAADPDEGAVVALLRDERVAVRRLDVAIARERLLQREREAREQTRHDPNHQETSSLFAKRTRAFRRRSVGDRCPRR